MPAGAARRARAGARPPRERDRRRAVRRDRGAVRAPALLTRRRATTSSAPTACCASPTPTAPRRGPGQFAMLAAAERWGGGEDERPFLPRAFSVARACATASRTSCSRTSARARARLCELRRGRRAVGARAARRGLRAARRRPSRAARAAAASGSRRWRSCRTRCARPGARAPVLLGFRDGAHARGRGAAARTRASPPTTARSAITASSPSCSPPSSTRDAHAVGLRLRPAADARGRARAVRRARRARAARARGRHGVRLRRLLRLRRADARRRLPARVRRRPGARRAPSSSTSTAHAGAPRVSDVEFCGLDARAPDRSTARARSTRSPRGARSARRCSSAFPFAAFVSKTITLRARAPATRRRGCGRRRRG